MNYPRYGGLNLIGKSHLRILFARFAFQIFFLLGSFSKFHLQRDRQKQVEDLLSTVNLLCLVLGVDLKHTIHMIHPTLNDSIGVKDISENTIKSLTAAVVRLSEVKMKRWKKVL